MAIKWRVTGAVDIVTTPDSLTITQTVQTYDEAAPGITLTTVAITAERNLDQVIAAPTAQLADLIDKVWLPKATEACRLAKRQQQADGYEAQAITYLATKQAAQAGV